MRNRIILATVILCAILSVRYSSGPASVVGQGYTGAPGETGTLCGTCHSDGSYGVPIALLEIVDGMGSNVTSYVGGETYQISLTALPGVGTPAGHGFQLTVLDAANADVADFSNPSSNAKISIAFAVAGGRTYAEHTSASVSNIFTFDWTAPSVGTGSLTFYYNVNLVNATGGLDGDSGGPGYTTSISETTLPINLISFSAISAENYIDINWATASEVNNEGFYIEKINNQNVWESIGFVDGMGTNLTKTEYTFTDKNVLPNKNYFYRLKQIDFDGRFEHTKTVSAKINGKRSIGEFYPNPANEFTSINLLLNNEENIAVDIFNILGKRVYSESFQAYKGESLELNILDLKPGNFVARISIGNDTFVRKLIKI